MQVVSYQKGAQIAERDTVVALGLFDGVHLAHRELIGRARQLADKAGLLLAVFTFPSESPGLKPGRERLYSTKQRLDLLATLGVDVAVIADFEGICGYSPEEFVSDCLIRDCRARLAVTGFNFRFGKGASAGAGELCSLMRQSGQDCEILDEVSYEGRAVSTSLIRELISTRRIDTARRLLTVPFYVEGEVKSGLGLGKELGSPTLNMPLPDCTLRPPRGVFRTAALIDGRLYPAVTNVGACPTVGEREEHLETHVIGKLPALYGKKVKVFFLDFLREEKTFSSKKELEMQINVDKNAALPQEEDEIWAENGPNLP